jgi:outer membrane murein-binding lipoprotein Lpp
MVHRGAGPPPGGLVHGPGPRFHKIVCLGRPQHLAPELRNRKAREPGADFKEVMMNLRCTSIPAKDRVKGQVKVPAMVLPGLLAALLMVAPAARAQSPGAASNGQTDTAAPSLRELQEQIQALGSDVRAMKAEVEDARTEAARLRQDLQNASQQVQALKNQLGQATSQAPAQTAAAAAGAAAPGAPGSENSLDSRVSKVEDDQQLQDSKTDSLAQTKVESGSKYRVRLSGMALFNAFSTRGDVSNYDLPTFAGPSSPSQPNAVLGATFRQSILGLDVYGPDIAGATTRADIRADFFGGFPGSPEGITTGLLRLRTAGIHFDWENTSLVVGQYAPIISPLSPTSLVSVGYPALSSAGNLWVWTPQVYVEHRFSLPDKSKLTVQSGIMDSLSGVAPMNSPYRDAQPGEQSGQPAYTARVAVSHDSEMGPFSLGFGGYYAPQNWGYDRKVTSYAATADWNVPLSRWFALSGEFFHGRALGGLGAAQGQSVAVTGNLSDPTTLVRGLNSTGGWTQLKFMPINRLEFNGAFGEDFSVPPSLGYTTTPYVVNGFVPLGRNASAFFNTIYHLRSNLMLSAEYRRLRTAELQPDVFSGNVVSLGAAALF